MIDTAEVLIWGTRIGVIHQDNDKAYSSFEYDKDFLDKDDSGQVFEPKTVLSSFVVNSKSTFCYLFAVDLASSEFVWLNCARASMAAVAGETYLWFLTDIINVTDLLNVKWFFELLATEVCDDISSADVVVTDKSIDVPAGVTVIREYDTEKIIALMNS